MGKVASWYKEFAQSHENLKHSIAGAGAGVVSSVVTCPLDVVKTRLQNQGKAEAGVIPYRGTVGTLSRIWKEEGIRGLYRGLGVTVIGYMPTWAIYFTAYDYCKARYGRNMDSDKAWLIHIASAMSAGAASTSLTNPLWVIKTRMMTQNERTAYRYKNSLDAFITIGRQEGIRGYYKGLGSSLLGVSHVAVQFPLYEKLKRYLHADTSSASPVSILLASSLSKMAASMATYPHEVIRTRLQNQTTKPFKYKGIFHAVKVILAEEGVRGLYKGLPTNLLRTVPSSKEYALTSALHDRRFNPIRLQEVPLLSCGVSLLTDFEEGDDYLDWEIGKHGIWIEFINDHGHKRTATYLPEVIPDQGWTKVEAIDSLLRKGGFRGRIDDKVRNSIVLTRYQSSKAEVSFEEYKNARPHMLDA